MARNYREIATQLEASLGLNAPPLAITFSKSAPAGVPHYEVPMPAPTPDGRTGPVSAGCVFWMKATDRTFTTNAADHANCSIGSFTHGFKTLEEAAKGADIAAMVECNWVSPEGFPLITHIKEKPGAVTYGPLSQATDPDVVFLRVNPKQAMVLVDGLQGVRFEGKPQCHIIPIAKELNQVAISFGCMASRVRTGMPNGEMTLAIPIGRIEEVIAALQKSAPAEYAVAGYASDDAKRFA